MKFSSIPAFIALFQIGMANAKVIQLDDSNFHQMTKDKIVFVKFFAPWCGHCKAMAGDWERLGKEITDSNIVIAEVDCTSEVAEEICEENNVQGFPTLKYGDGLSLEDYQGSRDFDEMLVFAKNHLKPTCSPRNVDLCGEEEKAIIDKFMAMSYEELEKVMEDVEDNLDDLDAALEEETQKLQDEYAQIMQKKNIEIKKAKEDANYSTMKVVLSKLQNSKANDEL